MRIIGGELRRRRLYSPKDETTTRPIPDRVKESLFNLLRGHCEGVAVFDGFAGTGAIGLEAISRGASRCVFVEWSKTAADTLERNIAELGVGPRCEVVRGDALGPGALLRCPDPAHLIFLDPPYETVRQRGSWERVRVQASRLSQRLTETGYLVLRTPWPALHEDGGRVDLSIPGTIGPETHTYGGMAVHLYMRASGAEGEPAAGL